MRCFIIFISFWLLFVYDFVVRWIWSSKGWLREFGSLDFVGGMLVYIVSGMMVVVFVVFCFIELRGNLFDFFIDVGYKVW